MSQDIAITIPGTPVAKPRMTQRDRWKKRLCVVRYRTWCDHAREVAGELPPANQIDSLSWVAYFSPPKSWTKKKREAAIGELHRQTPDRDNIDKAVLDCFFKEDSGIAAGSIEKRWDLVARLEIVVTVSPPLAALSPIVVDPTKLLDKGPPLNLPRHPCTPAPVGSGPEGETCRTCTYPRCGQMRFEWAPTTPTADVRPRWPACNYWKGQ